MYGARPISRASSSVRALFSKPQATAAKTTEKSDLEAHTCPELAWSPPRAPEVMLIIASGHSLQMSLYRYEKEPYL